MTTHIVKESAERAQLILWLQKQGFPFTVDIRKGKHRSVEQNKLQRKWCKEIHEQTDGAFDSPEAARGYCKLHFGVPIMREDSGFRDGYDRIIKPLSYESKLEIMKEPLDFSVTRLMTTEQKSRYLDAIYAYFTDLGLRLTRPDGME